MKTLTMALLLLLAGRAAAQTQPSASATDWIDPDTGHRVIRLSTEPGSQSLYFHQNAYTARGDKMFITLPGGMATIDLTTLGVSPCKVERIADGIAGGPVVGRNTRIVYYSRGSAVMATHLDTHETRTVCQLPQGLSGASGWALNADETLLASTGNDPRARDIAATQPAPPRSPFITPNPPNGRGEGSRSMVLFTVNVQTGEVKRVHYGTSWLNHTQYSPTDPRQLLFGHEGDWHNVDRIWTVRDDGSALKLMHLRTMANEIAEHEFFSYDGKTVWYDLQTPRSGQFWIGGTDLATGEELRYPVDRAQWSVHYNQSRDGRLFSGDGGGPNSVANRTPLPDNQPLPTPGNGMWMYLFTPQPAPWENLKVGDKTVRVGKLTAEKLVNLSQHNYTLEPNGTFSPDNKWVIFRANFQGASHVYAVQIAKH